jgi:hypothetical protein
MSQISKLSEHQFLQVHSLGQNQLEQQLFLLKYGEQGVQEVRRLRQFKAVEEVEDITLNYYKHPL